MQALVAGRGDEIARVCRWFHVRRLEVFGSAAIGIDFDPGRSEVDFLAAYESEFEIIDKALNRLSKGSPQLAARIPEAPQVVAFRNLLIHDHAVVDDPTVWRFAHEDLPSSHEHVAALPAELDDRPKKPKRLQ